MKFRIQETSIVCPGPPVRKYLAVNEQVDPKDLLRTHYSLTKSTRGLTDQDIQHYLVELLRQDRHTELKTKDWLDAGVTEMNATLVSTKDSAVTVEIFRGISQLDPIDPYCLQDDVDVRGAVARMSQYRVKLFTLELSMKRTDTQNLYQIKDGETFPKVINRFREWAYKCDEINFVFARTLGALD